MHSLFLFLSFYFFCASSQYPHCFPTRSSVRALPEYPLTCVRSLVWHTTRCCLSLNNPATFFFARSYPRALFSAKASVSLSSRQHSCGTVSSSAASKPRKINKFRIRKFILLSRFYLLSKWMRVQKVFLEAWIKCLCFGVLAAAECIKMFFNLMFYKREKRL